MSRAAVFWAVFLKDIRLFWPLAAVAAAAVLTATLYGVDSPIGPYLPLTASLVSALFFLGLIHQDAPASLRHDWLTRPIGSLELLLAKALLAAVVLLLPSAVGGAVAAAHGGASVSEALLIALDGMWTSVEIGFVLLLVAAVTSTLLEAGGVLVGLVLLFALAAPVLQRISGLSTEPTLLGSAWVVMSAFGLVLLAGGIVALWFQYAARRTVAARATLGATLGLLAITWAAMSWDTVFAVQRALTRQAPAPADFAVGLAPGCFESGTLAFSPKGATEVEAAGPWTNDQREAAGPGAVFFWTALRERGLPEGWRMTVSHVAATYLDAEGAELGRAEPAAYLSADAGEVRQGWLLNRERFEQLTDAAESLRLDYKLALLEPTRTAQIPVDGERHRLPGLGSCAASIRSGNVRVTCFKPGLQPDLLTAGLVGSAVEGASDIPDFAPDLLQRSPGRQHEIILPLDQRTASPRVTITAWEAATHLARRTTAAGALGGPRSSCPAPE